MFALHPKLRFVKVMPINLVSDKIWCGGLRVIVTHTDLDGVASAALILRAIGNVDRIMFAQPHQTHAVLGKIPNGAEVYVSDLGINEPLLDKVTMQVRRITSSGGRVRWFDHHVWDGEWIEALSASGAEVHVDTSTCGAGVVAKYFPVMGEGVEELVSATCSIDLWLFNDWRGNFLARYVGLQGGSKWREYVARELSTFKGELSKEMIAKVSEAFDQELRLYSKVVKEAKVLEVKGLKLAYYFKKDEEHVTSYIGNIMLSRFNADIALICKQGSLSLRSREFNVRELAKRLNGGGHPRAAGAPLRAPLIRVLLSILGFKKPLLNWCVNSVINELSNMLR